MKKFVCAFLTLAMLLSSASAFAAEAEERVTVMMDGEQMQFDVEPVIEDGRTLVPFRAIFEALGCIVDYYGADGLQTVFAYRGDGGLMMTIGENKMYFNNEESALDVPAKIVNDRTLVPLRAVSEAFDTEVVWLEEVKTVCLYPKRGAHKIKSVTSNQELKNDEGVTLIHASYSYPVIENPDENPMIDKINEEYKAFAEAFLKEAEGEMEDAQMLYEQMGKGDFTPYEHMLTYTVDTDRKGLLSVTNHEYYYKGGAHGTLLKTSRNFDLKSGTELKLSDILSGDSETEIPQMIYDVFVKYFEEQVGEEFDAEWAQQLENEIENVRYYLTDDSLVLYFDVYSVAPYVFGTPSVAIPYQENLFSLELTDANLDEYTFTLDGNPTTGYSWQIVSMDSERLEVREEYIESEHEEDIVGAGGTYKYTVKGLKQGNTALQLAYIPAGKNINDAEKAMTIELYVDKNNKITILDTDDDVEKVSIAPGM